MCFCEPSSVQGWKRCGHLIQAHGAQMSQQARLSSSISHESSPSSTGPLKGELCVSRSCHFTWGTRLSKQAQPPLLLSTESPRKQQSEAALSFPWSLPFFRPYKQPQAGSHNNTSPGVHCAAGRDAGSTVQGDPPLEIHPIDNLWCGGWIRRGWSIPVLSVQTGRINAERRTGDERWVLGVMLCRRYHCCVEVVCSEWRVQNPKISSQRNEAFTSVFE